MFLTKWSQQMSNAIWVLSSCRMYMGIYEKPRPFNHIFGGDRILRAWYRGIKNAGPRKRAQGRARDTPYITSYHHITMEFGGYLLNVAKNPTRARARKGEAQGVLSYQKVTGIFDNPHIYLYMHIIHLLTKFMYIYFIFQWICIDI